MKKNQNVIAMEINPKFVGALFTDRINNMLRVFCFHTNGSTSQFDMPAEENLDNLQVLRSRLNMEESCSSVIVDEVVQGRIYVRTEKMHWLYTLLSTPGNVLPPFNTGICDLPWRHCWRSQTVEVLEYGNPGDSVHCFAIRTEIGENDAMRLEKGSSTFTNPVAIQSRQPQRRLCLKIGMAIGCLALVIAAAAFLKINQNARVSFQPRDPIEATADTTAASYYLLNNHQISGPYPVKVVASMTTGGLLNSETLCRPENSTDWFSLTTLFSIPTKK